MSPLKHYTNAFKLITIKHKKYKIILLYSYSVNQVNNLENLFHMSLPHTVLGFKRVEPNAFRFPIILIKPPWNI